MALHPSLSTCRSTFWLFWKTLILSFRDRKSSLFQKTVKFAIFFEKVLLKFPLWETVFLTDERIQINTKALATICFYHLFRFLKYMKYVWNTWGIIYITMILLTNWVMKAMCLNKICYSYGPRLSKPVH